MVSKILVALCVAVAVVSAVPAQPANQVAGGWGGFGGWGPGGGWRVGAGGWGQGAGGWGQGVGGWGQGVGGWGPGAGIWGHGAGGMGVNPWIPPWVPALTPQWAQCSTIGTACVDCSTKAVCTPIGGFQVTCSDPTLPYCNLGECSATPTTECAPVQAVPFAGTV